MSDFLDDLTAVIRNDVLAIVTRSLDAVWPSIVAGRTADEVAEASNFGEALQFYLTHLFARGPLVAPPDAPSRGSRTLLTRNIWTRALSDENLMAIEHSSSLLQLCRANQLVYLSISSVPPLIRFVTEEVPAEVAPDAVRTTGADLGGAIRVVPVVSGSIRVVA